MLVFIVSIVIVYLIIMLAIAFITLLERKLLGLSQDRLSPNKVIFKGVLQPVIDGLKLITKIVDFIQQSNQKIFISVAVLRFRFFLIFIRILPFFISNLKLRWLLIIVLIGLAVYYLVLIGWLSRSKYPLLGSIRAVAQSISYEIRLYLLIFPFIIIFSSISINILLASSFILIVITGPLILLLFISVLAEINRAPFDFIERERELVSGFNTEFSRILFVMIFLREYGYIILYSLLLCTILSIWAFIAIRIIILFVRRVYPRYRYDKLIQINWVKVLPCSIIIITLFTILFY